jgi:tRNA1(Val) A37 N6-methylase TrmN6
MDRVLEPEAMDTPEEADAYASMDHSEANTAFVERLFELGAAGHMLDIGTGPGQIPLLVCARCAS